MKRLCSLFVLMFFASAGFGQTTAIDSLRLQLRTTTGIQRVKILNQYAKMFWTTDPDSAKIYSTEALQLARKHHDKMGEAQSLNNLGIAHYYMGENNDAMRYFEQSLEVKRQLKDKRELVSTLNNLGIITEELGRLDEASDYYIRALKIYEQLDDRDGISYTLSNIGILNYKLNNYEKALEYLLRSYRVNKEEGNDVGTANSLRNIGIVYYDLSNYDKAIEYQLSALKIYTSIQDFNGIANSLGNIGMIYNDLKDFDKALEYYLRSLDIDEQIENNAGIANTLNSIGYLYDDLDKFDKALEYYFRSLEISRKIGNLIGSANSLNNIGIVYRKTGDMDNALKYQQQALDIYEELGYRRGIAASYNNIGKIYSRKNDLGRALINLEKALPIAKEIEMIDLETEIYESISQVYENKHNYRKALEYFKMFTAVKDSIFTTETVEKLSGLQTTYEVEKQLHEQEGQIEILKKDNEIYRLQTDKQKLMVVLLIVVLTALLVISFVIIYRYRLKHKANQQLKEQVEERTRDLRLANQQLTQQMTERQRLEQQLRTSERLAAIGQLAAGIAHEINQPLHAINFSLDNMAVALEDESTDQTYINGKIRVILGDINRIRKVIDHIRLFSREQQSETCDPFIVNESIENALSMIQEQYHQHDIKVKLDLHDSLSPVLGNVFKYEQVILNLLSNAKDAVEERISLKETGYVPEIHITTFESEKMIITEVWDNGKGISEEARSRIFDPFYTTKGIDKGTGLGLSISFGIVAEMNGDISVESNHGYGTLFRIRLPQYSQ